MFEIVKAFKLITGEDVFLLFSPGALTEQIGTSPHRTLQYAIVSKYVLLVYIIIHIDCTKILVC